MVIRQSGAHVECSLNSLRTQTVIVPTPTETLNVFSNGNAVMRELRDFKDRTRYKWRAEMSRVAKSSWIAAILLLFGGTIGCKKSSAMVSVYYVPIGLETLVPVTSENIARVARRCEVSDPAVAEEIIELSVAGQPIQGQRRFSAQRLRVKVVESARDGGQSVIALVDNEGYVKRETDERMLNAAAFRKLQAILRKVSCRRT
jgi:hypothetical protein